MTEQCGRCGWNEMAIPNAGRSQETAYLDHDLRIDGHFALVILAADDLIGGERRRGRGVRKHVGLSGRIRSDGRLTRHPRTVTRSGVVLDAGHQSVSKDDAHQR